MSNARQKAWDSIMAARESEERAEACLEAAKAASKAALSALDALDREKKHAIEDEKSAQNKIQILVDAAKEIANPK